MIKSQKVLACLAVLVIAIIIAIVFGTTKYLEDRAYKEALQSYRISVNNNVAESDYPGKIAIIVETYDFYKNMLFHFDGGETEELLRGAIEFDLIIRSSSTALDDYSLPRALVNDELIATLEELITEEFIKGREEKIRNLLDNI